MKKENNKNPKFFLVTLLLIFFVFCVQNALALEPTYSNTTLTPDQNYPTSGTVQNLYVRVISPQIGSEITTDSFNMEVYSSLASYVEVYVSPIGSNQPQKVGTSTNKTSAGIFNLKINVKEVLSNGSYLFIVKAKYGEQVATTEIGLKINLPLETPVNVDNNQTREEVSNNTTNPTSSTTINATSTITTNTTSDDNEAKNTTVRVLQPISETKITSKIFELVIYSPDADRVELRIRKDGSSGFEYFGSASKKSSGNWGILIDNAARLPNGRYFFLAKSLIGGKFYESREIALNIAFVENQPPVSDSGLEISVGQQALNQGGLIDSDGDFLGDDKEKELGTDPNSSDTDKDGLSDSEEVRIKTNPKNPDTDRDGFLDGDEIKNGFDPLKYSPGDESDKIVFENPKETGQVSLDYKIENIELEKRSSTDQVLRLKGKAIPNSFVTIYIFSDPIVITVKTDADGNWVYELDKQLDDGEHEAYVAVTDNTGKITSKSEPLRFVKTAEAATVISGAQAQEVIKNQSPAQKSKDDFMIFALLAAVIFLGIALAVVGIINHRHIYDKESD